MSAIRAPRSGFCLLLASLVTALVPKVGSNVAAAHTVHVAELGSSGDAVLRSAATEGNAEDVVSLGEKAVTADGVFQEEGDADEDQGFEGGNPKPASLASEDDDDGSWMPSGSILGEDNTLVGSLLQNPSGGAGGATRTHTASLCADKPAAETLFKDDQTGKPASCEEIIRDERQYMCGHAQSTLKDDPRGGIFSRASEVRLACPVACGLCSPSVAQVTERQTPAEVPPPAPCEDAASSGIKFRSGSLASCAELHQYCQHVTLGEHIRSRCKKTCSLCPIEIDETASSGASETMATGASTEASVDTLGDSAAVGQKDPEPKSPETLDAEADAIRSLNPAKAKALEDEAEVMRIMQGEPDNSNGEVIDATNTTQTEVESVPSKPGEPEGAAAVVTFKVTNVSSTVFLDAMAGNGLGARELAQDLKREIMNNANELIDESQIELRVNPAPDPVPSSANAVILSGGSGVTVEAVVRPKDEQMVTVVYKQLKDMEKSKYHSKLEEAIVNPDKFPHPVVVQLAVVLRRGENQKLRMTYVEADFWIRKVAGSKPNQTVDWPRKAITKAIKTALIEGPLSAIEEVWHTDDVIMNIQVAQDTNTSASIKVGATIVAPMSVKHVRLIEVMNEGYGDASSRGLRPRLRTEMSKVPNFSANQTELVVENFTVNEYKLFPKDPLDDADVLVDHNTTTMTTTTTTSTWTIERECRDKSPQEAPIFQVDGSVASCGMLKIYCSGHAYSERVRTSCPVTCLVCRPDGWKSTTTSTTTYNFEADPVPLSDANEGCSRRRRWGYCSERRRRYN